MQQKIQIPVRIHIFDVAGGMGDGRLAGAEPDGCRVHGGCVKIIITEDDNRNDTVAVRVDAVNVAFY
jgi:hypothetical protein